MRAEASTGRSVVTRSTMWFWCIRHGVRVDYRAKALTETSAHTRRFGYRYSSTSSPTGPGGAGGRRHPTWRSHRTRKITSACEASQSAHPPTCLQPGDAPELSSGAAAGDRSKRVAPNESDLNSSIPGCSGTLPRPGLTPRPAAPPEQAAKVRAQRSPLVPPHPRRSNRQRPLTTASSRVFETRSA